MKAILEVVKFNINDVITTSTGGAPACPSQTTQTCEISGITQG